MWNHGFSNNKLWFSEVKYSFKAKLLDRNTGSICYFQGTLEDLVNATLDSISEAILREILGSLPKVAAEVVSEDEHTEVFVEAYNLLYMCHCRRLSLIRIMSALCQSMNKDKN